MSSFEFKVACEGGVARIDLNRPDEGNALTRDMMVMLARLIGELGARADNRVIVIEARGPQFCRGRDGRGESREGFSPHDVRTKMMGPVLGVYEAINNVALPVVALVQGPAIGFGCALSGGCDITLASDAARFSFSEIKHGIPATLAMSAVTGKVPQKALAYMIYSGEELSAEEGLTFGLVSRVYPGPGFAASANKFVTDLASRPRLHLETIKKYQRNSAGLSAAMAAEYAGSLLALVR
jgi:enoyl-CoA hydratase/carnithine racemase